MGGDTGTGTPATARTWAGFGTLGIELETAVVDATTWALAPHGGARVLADLAGSPRAPYLHRELHANTVEMVTPPCRSVAEAVDHIRESAAEISRAAGSAGLAVLPAGTHPFSRAAAQPISPGDDRYRMMAETFRHGVTRQNTCAVHLHYGVSGGAAAFHATRLFLALRPVFIALAASSPYADGVDTGMLSYRPMLGGVPFWRVPRVHDTWAAYERDERELRRIGYGIVTRAKDVRFEVRASRHGTIEVRTPDAVGTAMELGGLAALGWSVIALAEELAAEGATPATVTDFDVEANGFHAMANGLDAACYHDGRATTLRTLLPELLDSLAMRAARLGCGTELGGVERMAAVGPSAVRQRAAVEGAGGDLRAAVVRAAAEMNRDAPLLHAAGRPVGPSAGAPVRTLRAAAVEL